MNAVLERMLASGIGDEETGAPLGLTGMDPAEGAIIMRAFREARPDTSIEIGMCYAVSTLYACAALSENRKPARHIVMDPIEFTYWHGAGMRNVERAGYAHLVDFRAEYSEAVLPRLIADGTRIQAAIIDGGHTFDQVMVDFYFVNKMLDVDGIVVFDDTNFPAIAPVMRFVATYPAYRLFDSVPGPAKHWHGRLRRALGRRFKLFRREWDQPRCMAFKKITEDRREWNWHVDF